MTINGLAATFPVEMSARRGTDATGSLLNGFRFAEHHALEYLRIGVVLVDRDSRVASINKAAHRLLRDRDTLAVISGRLVANSLRDRDALHECIAAAHTPCVPESASSRALRIPRNRTGGPLDVIVAPLSEPIPCGAGIRPTAVVYIVDLVPTGSGRCMSLAQRYGLTPAEARVATFIANGHSGHATARLLHVSYNTIKTHLRHIYSKTGVGEHRALMRLLLVSMESE